ncbi:ribonuclease P protein component [Beutenbergia cavernae]
MRRSDEFARTFRRGTRRGTRRLVVHAATTDAGEPPRVGFVVSKAVGGAVVRNRVKRRLRAVLMHRVTDLLPGTLVVVRALPPSANATSAELERDVDGSLTSLGLRAKVVPAR